MISGELCPSKIIILAIFIFMVAIAMITVDRMAETGEIEKDTLNLQQENMVDVANDSNTVDKMFYDKILKIEKQELFWYVYFDSTGKVVVTAPSGERMLNKQDMFTKGWKYELNDTGIRYNDEIVYQVLLAAKY